MPCPSDKKFIRRASPDGAKCVYWPDERYSVPLVTVGTIVFGGWTVEDAQQEDSAEATPFISERDRFNQELTKVYENMDKQKKIDDAFRDLQKAENVRDKSPEAYQVARTAYYTLLKGDSWLNEEKQRIAGAEVAPEVQKYREAVSAINTRNQEQQKTIDVVKGIKDRLISLKDDMKYSVTTFGDQLEKVKIQLNMENRSREEVKEKRWNWLDLGLNILLVIVLLWAVYTMVRRFFMTPRPRPFPTTTIRIPTYTPPVV
jgi:hypothetical protein